MLFGGAFSTKKTEKKKEKVTPNQKVKKRERKDEKSVLGFHWHDIHAHAFQPIQFSEK